MIASLRGIITDKLDASLVLEAGGVGYELFTTAEDWGAAKAGAEMRFYIHEHIREDAHQLYAFSAPAGRQLFAQLLTVSGVGPKLAMQVLSAAGEARLRQAIAAGDPELLRGVSGIGPKTAQRVIVDLRGKVEAGGPGAAGLAPVTDSTYQALVALGYTPAQATAAVTALPAGLTGDQARLKAALKGAGPR